MKVVLPMRPQLTRLLHDRPRLAPSGRIATMAFALLLASSTTARAVAVSPASLYLDSRTRSGMLTLFNAGSLPEEIEIGFAFGYPRSDAAGAISVELVPVAPDSEPSLVPFLRAFPRRLRLEPGQRQVVRVIVNPPPNLPVGEYWGRITILSRGGQPPIEQRQGDVTMHIDLATQIVAAISYRNGAVSTGVQVANAKATNDSAGPSLSMDLVRQGNAAYLGRVQAELVSPTGEVVADAVEEVAVYHTLHRVFEFPLKPGAPNMRGYVIRFTVTATRPDLPPDSVLPAPAVTGSAVLP